VRVVVNSSASVNSQRIFANELLEKAAGMQVPAAFLMNAPTGVGGKYQPARFLSKLLYYSEIKFNGATHECRRRKYPD
jgi:hypothetical protein